MTNSKPTSTLMSVTNLHHLPTYSTPISNITEYRALVGSLQYLTLTRPNISFAVNKLSQFMHAPTILHRCALKQLLRYLNGTIDKGILFKKDSPLILHGFTDDDWDSDKATYKRNSGYIVYLGSNPIAWSSKRQPIIARSPSEAEFKAVVATTTEVLWVISLLKDFRFKSALTPSIYCDNLNAMQ